MTMRINGKKICPRRCKVVRAHSKSTKAKEMRKSPLSKSIKESVTNAKEISDLLYLHN